MKIRSSLNGWNGYSVEEVDEFLDQVTEELEKKCKEVSALNKELEQLKKELSDCKGRESAIQNTLIIAQSTGDEIINNAKQQATQIIKDAEGTARQSVETLNQSIIIKRKEQEDLENQIQAAINWSGALAIQYKGGVMLWPIAVDGTYITSPYGNRLHPIQGVYRYHDGIDIGNAGYGAPVIAAADGIVTYAGVMSGYGNCVMINHGDGIVTLYGHGQEIYTELGATVKQGDVIMAVGSTGNSTGPHLHFEVRKFGVAVDPIPYLQGDNTKNESNTNENTIINNNEVANVT